MGLEYVDIFYSHRFDPETPLEETMGALDAAVHQASSAEQLEQNVAALERSDFESAELSEIDRYAVEGGVNIWAASSEA